MNEVPSGGGVPASPQTILVVDDEPVILRMLEWNLSRAGYRVLTAIGGAEGLLRAAEHPGHLDLVISDVVMPGLSGPRMIQALGRSRPRTRVLFMSGHTGSEALEEVDDSFYFLAKPFRKHTLLAKVAEALRPHDEVCHPSATLTAARVRA